MYHSPLWAADGRAGHAISLACRHWLRGRTSYLRGREGGREGGKGRRGEERRGGERRERKGGRREKKGREGKGREEGVLCAVPATALFYPPHLLSPVGFGIPGDFAPALGRPSDRCRYPRGGSAGTTTRRGGLQSRYYVCAGRTQPESRPDTDSRDEHETRNQRIHARPRSAPAATVTVAVLRAGARMCLFGSFVWNVWMVWFSVRPVPRAGGLSDTRTGVEGHLRLAPLHLHACLCCWRRWSCSVRHGVAVTWPSHP